MISPNISAAVIKLLLSNSMRHWPSRSLSDLIALSNGKAMTKDRMVPHGSIPVYGANGVIGATDKALIHTRAITIGRVGSCGEVTFTEAPAWVSDNAMWISSVDAGLDLTYLYFALKSLPLAEGAKIAAMPSISQAHVLRESIPLPPLREQSQIGAFLKDFSEGNDNWRNKPLPPPLSGERRIVARIEELSAKIEEARVLRNQSAGEAGALVASELRTVVLTLVRRFGSTRLESLIENAGYGTSIRCAPDRLHGTVPVLRIPNVASERVNFEDLKFGCLTTLELERVSVAPGDILVVRTNGSLDLVGRCAVVPDLKEPTAFASYMIRIRCDKVKVLPEYLQLMLKHLRTDGHLIEFARTTAGQYNVSLGRLRAAEVPVPPLNEQEQLLSTIGELEQRVRRLREIQTDITKELDAFMPSIFSKAFSGEL